MSSVAQGRWTRDTIWRQGHVLPIAAIEAGGLFHPDDPENSCVVAISHDCDITHEDLDVEPNVEVIVGRFIPNQNGNFTLAKSPRTLHLEAKSDGQVVAIELTARQKRFIEKNLLAQFEPESSIEIPDEQLRTLRTWLALRYYRAAFADEFERRFDVVRRKFSKILESLGIPISEILFDVDEGRDIDHSDGTPYSLNILLLYSSGEDFERDLATVESAAERILKLFGNQFFEKDRECWSQIQLKDCVPISEEDITVAQVKLFKRWRLEHMSLGDEAAAAPRTL